MALPNVHYTTLRELTPASKNINVFVIVLDIYNTSVTKDGREVKTVRVADKTGSMKASVWDDLGRAVRPGDILNMLKVYTNVFKSQLTINVGKFGEIVKGGEFCFVFSEFPDLSQPRPDLKDHPTGRDKDEFRAKRSLEGEKPGSNGKDDSGPPSKRPSLQGKPGPSHPPAGALPPGAVPGKGADVGSSQAPRPTVPNDPRAQRWAARDPRVVSRKPLNPRM